MTATVSKFRYEAETLDGESVKGEVEASSVSAARNQLAVDGMRVRKIKERKSFSEIEITKSRVPLTEVMNFSRQMATFTRAGVPVLEALATLREDCSNKRFAGILQDAEERVQGGAQLSQALAAHRDVFPNYYGPILSSSELTGRMDEAFDQLTDYIKRDLALTRQVRKALIYPCILLAVAIGVCLIIVVFAIPRFATFFEDFDAELPLPTRMLMAVSDFVGSTAGLITGVVAVAVIIGLTVFFKSRAGKPVFHRMLLKAPVVGAVVQNSATERFARVLSVLLNSGVPLPEALPVGIEATNNIVFQNKLNASSEKMLAGQGFAQPLQDTGLFPKTVIQMVRVGERTGELPDQLENVAAFHEEELTYAVEKLTQWFEPAIIVFIGVVVGFVALAMVSAMYGIYGQV